MLWKCGDFSDLVWCEPSSIPVRQLGGDHTREYCRLDQAENGIEILAGVKWIR